MDTMYRKKAREAEEALTASKKQKEKNHVADDYNPKIRPRETHPDAISAEKRISKNLKKMNLALVETPAAELSWKEKSIFNEDAGARVVTRASAVRASVPMAMILTCVMIAAVFMYLISLYIAADEYSHEIDILKGEITELKEEATKLEIQMEGKYDLNEIEQIATQNYGMVSSTVLPKKYISINEYLNRNEEPIEEKGAFEKFWDSVLSFLGLGDE